jgi:hypothetical protein
LKTGSSLFFPTIHVNPTGTVVYFAPVRSDSLLPPASRHPNADRLEQRVPPRADKRKGKRPRVQPVPIHDVGGQRLAIFLELRRLPTQHVGFGAALARYPPQRFILQLVQRSQLDMKLGRNIFLIRRAANFNRPYQNVVQRKLCRLGRTLHTLKQMLRQ